MSAEAEGSPLLDEENEATWALLHDQFELAQGFWLGFLFSLGLKAPRTLAERTKAMLRGVGVGFRRWRPERADELRDVLIALVSAAKEGTTDCLWVEAITERIDETSPESAWSEARSEFLMRANEQREVFVRQHRGALILVLPPSSKVQAHERAPDLWSYREFVAELMVKHSPDGWDEWLKAIPTPHAEATLSAEDEQVVRRAEEALSRATRFPQGLNQVVSASGSLVRANRPDDARRMLLRVLSLPRGAEVPPVLISIGLQLLAWIEKLQGDAQSALDHFRAAVSFAPKTELALLTDVHLQSARLLRKQGDLRGAQEQCELGLPIAREAVAERETPRSLFNLLGLIVERAAVRISLGDGASDEMSDTEEEESLNLARRIAFHPDATPEMRVPILKMFDHMAASHDALGRSEDARALRAEAQALATRYGIPPPARPTTGT